MHIIEVTWRNRNDFHFVAYCRWCGERSRWHDGYADSYYQQEVLPARHCPHCDKDEAGTTPQENAA
jgi:hypothetical protein